MGQGLLLVDFALYLHALGWTGVAIGLLFTSSSLFGGQMSLLVGIRSDRLPRKPFLLVYESIVLLGSLAALVSAQPLIVAGAAILGGYGYPIPCCSTAKLRTMTHWSRQRAIGPGRTAQAFLPSAASHGNDWGYDSRQSRTQSRERHFCVREGTNLVRGGHKCQLAIRRYRGCEPRPNVLTRHGLRARHIETKRENRCGGTTLT
jgi:hypothetical protein